MIASITELHLKSFWTYLLFIPHAMRSYRQAVSAKGSIQVNVKAQGLLIQRTLTVWETPQDMAIFVRSEPHLTAMKRFRTLANTSYVYHFDVSAPPTWEEALDLLKKHGRSYS